VKRKVFKEIIMPLRVYNTLSAGKEEFVSQRPGRVGMYVCGVTVYDFSHIGHARANVVFDVISRYLRYLGYDVTYVRNYTDIDDKIINRANSEGVPFNDVSERFIKEFDRDMEQLGLQLPEEQPKATEHMGEIIDLISTLIDKGFAYQAEGDVYYCVDRFADYLKLSKRNLDEMQAGARIEVDLKKRHPMDFALWKESKPGEPFWESPWGKGRPGWHIECSAMSMKYLGETFDIHGGGKDLIFPHHENEIAQSEAATGHPFARYWLHNGFVNINAEKMSKSLGNFFTIREVLERYDSEVLRFFLISAHYRSPLDFSDHNLNDAEAGLERIYSALASLDERVADGEGEPVAYIDREKLNGAEQELLERCDRLKELFEEAMNDDFNTALAIANVFDLVRSINRAVAEDGGRSPEGRALFALVREKLNPVGEVLGVFISEPGAYLARMKARRVADQEISPDEIERLILERAEARKAKDFKRSDEIRDYLLERNIQLLDGPGGTTWKVK
jgi:cysteinyl-tRNA synthetase